MDTNLNEDNNNNLNYVVLLGKEYGPLNENQESLFGSLKSFMNDFTSRFWFTYRSDFEPISTTCYTSDAGWGCMLRSGQMMMGETLIRHFLGRDWRLKFNGKKDQEKYVEILNMFNDRKTCVFSIQNIAIEGTKYGKKIGEWFGPATICSVLRALTLKSDLDLNVMIAQDGVIYKNQLVESCTGKSDPEALTKEDDHLYWRSSLILVPLRLGLESFNMLYENQIKMCLKFPQSVGIAGGRPNASLFFIGYEGSSLLYLDPHYTRPSIDITNFDEHLESDFDTFHCKDVRKIPIHRIDPSLVLGFYCKDKKDVIDFLERTKEIQKEKVPLFNIELYPPANLDDLNIEDFEVEFDSETENKAKDSSEDDF